MCDLEAIYLVDQIGVRYADIVFPASRWGKETFTRANGERRIRLYPKVYEAPGEAKPDWWIIAELSKKKGFEGFDWKNSNDVLEDPDIRCALLRHAQSGDENLAQAVWRALSELPLDDEMIAAAMQATGHNGPIVRDAAYSILLRDGTQEGVLAAAL